MKCIGSFLVIKDSKRFAYLYKNSKKAFNESFVIFYRGDKNIKEVGFTASKKIGNAVKRNFAKRRLRALFLEIIPLIESGSYLFVAKKSIVTVEYKKLKKELLRSLDRVNALKKRIS